MLTDQNVGVLTIQGGEWMKRYTIPPLLPGVRVHLNIDVPEGEPRSDAEVNIFCSVEPRTIKPDVYKALLDPKWCAKWNVIVTSHPCYVGLRDRVAVIYMNATFWVDPPDPQEPPKIFGISTIMSHHRYAEGHKLRHWIHEHWPSEVPGTVFHGSHPAGSPTALRQPYPADRRTAFQRMFHLVIENSKAPGYFTEKLMDCFRCRAVPIYWGAPDIDQTFDVTGMILIGRLNPDRILNVMRSLTVSDYEKRRDAIERNAKIAEELCEGENPDPFDRTLIPTQRRRLGALMRREQEKVREVIV